MLHRPKLSALPAPTSSRYSLQQMTLGTVLRVLRYLGIISPPMVKSPDDPVSIGGRWVSQAEFTTAAFDTWTEILQGWWDFFVTEFVICGYDSEFTGTNVRYSLLQGAVIIGIPVILLTVFITAIPTLLGILIVPFFISAAVIAPIVAILLWIGFSTGWRLLCFPALPSILFSTMGMQLLVTSVLLNKCEVLGGGLVQQASYNNSNCMRCDLWSSGAFTMFSCRDDLGWTSPFDVPVFWLKACSTTTLFCSGWLAALQDPSRWPAFFAAILRTQLVSDWLARWNNVNLDDPISYSAQYTCAFELIAAWVILVLLLGLLLTYGASLSPPRLAKRTGPIWQTLAWILALFGVVAGAALMLLFALIVLIYAALMASPTLIKHERRLRRKRQELNAIRRLQGLSVI